MISNTTINNPRTKGREKFITSVCCCVGRNTRDLIRTLSLDLDYCKKANNVWYCLGVKPICWECTSNLEPSWFCSLLLQYALWFLNLNWGGKPCFLYTCINHMSCLSTMTADFRSISSSITTSVSIIHCLWLITKNLSLLLCTERTNHLLLRTNIIRWTKILWGINNFGHDKCNN